MTLQEAVHVLRKHNGQVDDSSDGLLGCLRPYVGINESCFCEIVKTIYYAAPLFNGNCVDRDLFHTIWDLTRTARLDEHGA